MFSKWARTNTHNLINAHIQHVLQQHSAHGYTSEREIHGMATNLIQEGTSIYRGMLSLRTSHAHTCAHNTHILHYSWSEFSPWPKGVAAKHARPQPLSHAPLAHAPLSRTPSHTIPHYRWRHCRPWPEGQRDYRSKRMGTRCEHAKKKN